MEISAIEKYINPELLGKYAIEYGIALLGAVVIFIIGKMAAKWITRSLRIVLRKSKMDETLVSFLGNVIYFMLLAVVVIAALGQLGIETTTVAAVFAAAGLAIGLSLQNSLSNFASGVLIIAFRPFKVGDFVNAAGQSGTVEEVNIFTTHLKTPDNIGVIVPNSAITSGSIMNYNAHATRRIDAMIGISYEDDVAKAKAIIEEILKKDSRILPDPAPVVAVMALADSSVNIAVRPWVNSGDYWDTWFSLHEAIKTRFDDEGITIPFPQRQIIMRQAS